ncbi:hypothetical protein AMURIS_04369 [Acetatifactor muris]|jgi:hypothetical protein|uniref:LRAT domain-containing protein n=1 Tax=Acetatifactor muris TaxID=879566 RepID=A0A2K4ZMF5_9FIRM|nr:hypothetical protein [Eubacterium sp.]SOY31625.1 hypothetical protein AMURIS_04369 [Acetatifactor muris]
MKLIIRKDKIFTHIGIYLDDTMILHYSSKTNNFFRNDKIVKCNSIEEFKRDRKIRLIECKEKIYGEEFKRAIETFIRRQEDYHIIKNNCYTFVLWCLYHKRRTSLKDIFYFADNYKIPILSIYM